MQKFTAKIYRLDVTLCVDVPGRTVQKLLLAAKKEKGLIPVRGRFDSQRIPPSPPLLAEALGISIEELIK